MTEWQKRKREHTVELCTYLEESESFQLSVCLFSALPTANAVAAGDVMHGTPKSSSAIQRPAN